MAEVLSEEVPSGTSTYGDGIVVSPSDVGGWPQLKSTEAPTDTDHDGMPDEWGSKEAWTPRILPLVIEWEATATGCRRST